MYAFSVVLFAPQAASASGAVYLIHWSIPISFLQSILALCSTFAGGDMRELCCCQVIARLNMHDY